jgi:hypothetical protein
LEHTVGDACARHDRGGGERAPAPPVQWSARHQQERGGEEIRLVRVRSRFAPAPQIQLREREDPGREHPIPDPGIDALELLPGRRLPIHLDERYPGAPRAGVIPQEDIGSGIPVLVPGLRASFSTEDAPLSI